MRNASVVSIGIRRASKTPRTRRHCEDAERVLPHNLEAERSVLGAVLLDHGAIGVAREVVETVDFFRDAHRRIFDKMVKLADRGDAIDLVTVKEELARSGELEEIGGPVYIASLVDGVPRSTNVGHYALIIKDKSILRRVIFASSEILTKAYATDEDPTTIIADAASAFASITARENQTSTTLGADDLVDAVSVAREGQLIAERGIPYRWAGVIPMYGMLGILIAYAKVGKTTFSQALAAAVAMGRSFLGKDTQQARVLVIAAEDPPEYVAWLARHLKVAPGSVTFYRRSLILDKDGLAQVVGTVQQGGYGLVLISSWQAVVRGLIRDENDNAGAVQIVESVKAAARKTGVPWLIDAHSGKGEDQGDDADPARAMRGASAAAGAADFALSLRYADGPFGTRRKLSGKGRFVSFAPITMDFNTATGTYEVVATTKNAASETLWNLIGKTGALSDTPRTAAQIAQAAGLAVEGKVTNTHRRQVSAALKGRSEVGVEQQLRFGERATLYKRLNPDAVSRVPCIIPSIGTLLPPVLETERSEDPSLPKGERGTLPPEG